MTNEEKREALWGYCAERDCTNKPELNDYSQKTESESTNDK